MKNFLPGTALLCFALLSCTTEAIQSGATEQTLNANQAFVSRQGLGDATPANTQNPYDFAGAAQNELLDLYLDGNYSYSSIEEVSEKVALLAVQHYALDGQDTPPTISQEQIAAILTNPSGALGAIGTSPTLSAPAATGFSEFMVTLDAAQDATFEELYSLIIAYETTVINNPDYSSADKEVILTSTSIARYTIYYRKKRKDRDWDTSVGNIVAGASGAEENTISAVSMAVVTGISINNGITQ
ncbi:hypothetical protein Q765_13745 [Flavobacterium rivuli WB 3.3-2 = DSM 21788]|uniref:Lipoprotein n=1 Tax=Flavobacterium rivuli WB 3.3-2 = DSM 21788 TaxID=1121895 RepID=A0A0A2M2P7_9FLAO|nr:hypothetical protein [Flavobacterium rivuli]KGO85891.1 hypothetical protein Q765_13745 [Flavobacterium rivuli WB 3.3-2 = DSM 21788]